MQLGVAAVHAEQVGGEQRRLVAAGAGAHLQDGAALVGGVLRQQLDLELLLELLAARLERLEIGARHGDHLLVGGGVVDQRLEVGLLLVGGAQRLDRRHQRIERGELLGQLGVGRLIDAGIELRLDRVPAADHLLELVFGNPAMVSGLRDLEWLLPAARRQPASIVGLGANMGTRAAARRI